MSTPLRRLKVERPGSTLLAARPPVVAAAELPPDYPMCWERVSATYPPLLVEGNNGDLLAATMSEAHWYAAVTFENSTGIKPRIYRWAYPAFDNPELVHQFTGSDELIWDVMPCLAYLDGNLWWVRNDNAADTIKVEGGPVSSLPITSPTVLASGPGYEPYYQSLVASPATHKLFALRYIYDQPSFGSQLVELHPSSPGTVNVRKTILVHEIGRVFLEADWAADATGAIWCVAWGQGGDSGRICRYDPTADEFIISGVVRSEWNAPDFFVGTLDGTLLFGDGFSGEGEGVYEVDAGFNVTLKTCLDNIVGPRRGVTTDDGPSVFSPSFATVAWFHDDDQGVHRLVAPGPAASVAGADSFAAATDVSSWGSLVTQVSLAGATLEPGEPHPGTGRTLWWKWAPTEDMEVYLDTEGTYLGATLTVYTGTSLGDLVVVASGTQTGIPQNAIAFTAVRGTTYYIQVDRGGEY